MNIWSKMMGQLLFRHSRKEMNGDRNSFQNLLFHQIGTNGNEEEAKIVKNPVIPIISVSNMTIMLRNCVQLELMICNANI